MKDDLVVLVDESGQDAGTAPRLEIHGPDTPLHRAFSVHIFGPDGRVLLTRRALSKVTWPGVWTNSCCGHPKPGEPYPETVRRRVGEELGMEITDLEVALPDFAYRATDASGVVENEVCPVFVARAASEPRPDPDEVMDYRWIAWSDFVSAAERTPDLISPWSALQLPQLDGHIPTRFTSPQATQAPTIETTLARVDDLLRDESRQLTALWEAAVGGPPVDILGDEDLPVWLQQLMARGGKRLRPAMCHWGFVAAGGRDGEPGYDHLVRIAAALETLHTFGLIHDDIMDRSDTRRGQPTTHVRAAEVHRAAGGDGASEPFGTNIAILLGDLAHTEADRLADGVPMPLRQAWYELSIELIAGQRSDLTGAAAHRRDLEHAVSIAQLKSGSYSVERPLQLGAEAAGASRAARESLRAYGRRIGTVFALRDDYLGVWGDPATTGKPAGDDLRNGKATTIVGLAQTVLTGEAAEALARAGTARAQEGDIPLLQQTLIDTGIRSRVEAMIREGVDSAVAALDPAHLESEGIQGLAAIADRIAWRDR